MNTLRRSLILPPVLIAAVALAGQMATQSSTAQGDPTFAVDADPRGNAPNSVASIESCASVNTDDTFEVDLVITEVTDLLAWETYVHYDASVIQVIDRDVQQFLSQENEGVFDTSASVPNEDGRYRVGGANISQHASGASGHGVLTRLTMKALGEGVTTVEVGAVDITGDGIPDIGPTLADMNGNRIGDSDGDGFLDGPVLNAQVAVDTPCAEVLSIPVAGPVVDSPKSDGDDGTDRWIFAVIGVVAVLAVAAVGGLLWARRRSSHGDVTGGGP